MSHHKIYRDGAVHVLGEMCKTCVFRPGNLMQLNAGRLRGMVDDSIRDGGAIVCHSTLPYAANPGVEPAVCRGFFDRHMNDIPMLQMAARMDCIEEDPAP